jgi:hypothetical protein
MHVDGNEIPASWERLAARGADAGLIAEHAVALWRGMNEALSPIIGQSGLAALYQRSVYLTGVDHRCLQGAGELAAPPDSFAPLRAALAPLSGAEAARAASALAYTFRDLLAHLIGGSLTERLLRSVWISPSSGQAVQDTAS